LSLGLLLFWGSIVVLRVGDRVSEWTCVRCERVWNSTLDAGGPQLWFKSRNQESKFPHIHSPHLRFWWSLDCECKTRRRHVKRKSEICIGSISLTMRLLTMSWPKVKRAIIPAERWRMSDELRALEIWGTGVVCKLMWDGHRARRAQNTTTTRQ
jgi:hypothetical protein